MCGGNGHVAKELLIKMVEPGMDIFELVLMTLDLCFELLKSSIVQTLVLIVGSASEIGCRGANSGVILSVVGLYSCRYGVRDFICLVLWRL